MARLIKMMVDKWTTAARAWAADELKESRRSLLRYVGFGLSYGLVFILLSFLVPGISKEHQIMCWETAILAFIMTVYLVWTHLTI